MVIEEAADVLVLEGLCGFAVSVRLLLDGAGYPRSDGRCYTGREPRTPYEGKRGRPLMKSTVKHRSRGELSTGLGSAEDEHRASAYYGARVSDNTRLAYDRSYREFGKYCRRQMKVKNA